MTPAADTADRYQTFIGIPCDANADRLIAYLDEFIQAEKGDSRWQEYFRSKRAQQLKMDHDNLYFVGSQMNNLYAYFEGCDDEQVMELLWQLEQECC
jgi:hypothetical protein